MSDARIIVPVTIDESRLVSSTVADTAYPAYAAGTTYAAGDRVIKARRVWVSTAAGNLGHDPETLGESWWTEISPSNKWAMFDGLADSKTIATGPLTVVFNPGRINNIYLGGLLADSVDITIRDGAGGPVVFSEHVELTTRHVGGWYDYFFEPFKFLSSVVISGMPPISTAQVTLTLNGTGEVRCGMVVAGMSKSLGKTLYGLITDPNDYSYVKTNEWGVSYFKKRGASRNISGRVWLEIAEANRLEDLLLEILSVPVCAIFSDRPEHVGLRGFGTLTGKISYDHPRDCLLGFQLKGLL